MLAEDEVRLRWAEPPDDVARFRAVLSADELAAADRFRFERHRRVYVVAHGVLRFTLAECTGVDPRALRFERDARGKPELADRAVRFNLSHTDGLVLVGVTSKLDVGVDAERLDSRRGTDESLAERAFAPEELAAWKAEPDRATTFFTRWTLKESYLKARGDGLSLELRAFGFPALAERPRIETAYGDADAYQFLSFAPTPHHRAAAAVRARADTPVTWRVAPFR